MLPAKGNMRWAESRRSRSLERPERSKFRDSVATQRHGFLKGTHVNVTDASTGNTSKADLETVELNACKQETM